MTSLLTDERKAGIIQLLQEPAFRNDTAAETQKFLAGVEIDPDTPKVCLTAEMIADIMSGLKRPKTDRPKRTGKYKAHRVARSKEQWRVLTNYPNYEISSYGRVRSLQRTKPDDWLKPRWFRGQQKVVLYDKDGIRRERMVYWLLVGAGWLSAGKPKAETEEPCVP